MKNFVRDIQFLIGIRFQKSSFFDEKCKEMANSCSINKILVSLLLCHLPAAGLCKDSQNISLDRMTYYCYAYRAHGTES